MRSEGRMKHERNNKDNIGVLESLHQWQTTRAANRCPRNLCEEARGLLYEGLRPSSNPLPKKNHVSSLLYNNIALGILFWFVQKLKCKGNTLCLHTMPAVEKLKPRAK